MFSTTTYNADKTRVRAVRQQNKRVARIELEGGVNFVVTEASLPLKIGRELDCDITIPSGHVSRHHCELALANGVLTLKDSSSNGTLVGSQNLKGSSVVIDKRTVVVVAGDAQLVITPMNELEPVKNRRSVPDRRSVERRVAERRQEQIVVPFDQRKACRREKDRREIQRR
ncbi:MAG: FHA domain-containing protein [Pseudomonadales bacterium]